MFGKRLSQDAWYVRHVVERRDALVVDPANDLFGTEGWLGKLADERADFTDSVRFECCAHAQHYTEAICSLWYTQRGIQTDGTAGHSIEEGIMSINPAETKVALLYGGTSGERAISIQSGQGAAGALREAGYQVTMLDPANKEDLVKLVKEPFDVAFLCLHGKGGEDGTMQGMLEILGIPYTGPGVWSSATAMDKAKSKVHYLEKGISTPRSVTLHAADQMTPAELEQKLGRKIVVKPASSGSALGVSIVEGTADVQKALDDAFALDDEVVVETFVSGTELTVAVLGNDDPTALPVIEIVPQMGDFYDYESKYAAGGSQHICPARLSEKDTQHVQALAVAAHKALECQGVSRTDIILDENGTGWVLETNTSPGMTATSLLPDAGRAAGMSFPELCTKLIEYALEK